jgi:phosphoribosylformylglycinamidine cyclo-ligase
MSLDYKQAGVNIDAGNEAVQRIKSKVQDTLTPASLTQIGSFGGALDLGKITQGMKNPVLVQSCDGVGTKLMIAKETGIWNGVGLDVVHNNVNDILCLGARPISFLDYIGCSRLDPDIIETVVDSMTQTCKDHEINLLGGEMAEMPGMFANDEIDVIGMITGVVDKEKIITGKTLEEGDLILGLSSGGLHTNGFSLARKALFKKAKFSPYSKVPELTSTLGETLLEPHISYQKPVFDVLDSGIEIKGLSHITGGGFVENIPRILPNYLDAEIDLTSFPIPAIFNLIQKAGEIEKKEMYRVFNMGIGMVAVINKQAEHPVKQILRNYSHFQTYTIGRIISGRSEVRLLS